MRHHAGKLFVGSGSVSVAIGSRVWHWEKHHHWLIKFRLRLRLTLGHKENSDHLRRQPWPLSDRRSKGKEKEITYSNDESSKQRFDKKKEGEKRENKAARQRRIKNIATEHMKILTRKLRKHSEETSGKRWK